MPLSMHQPLSVQTRDYAISALIILLVSSGCAPGLYAQAVDAAYPTREYVRLGGRVIAIENPAAPTLDRSSVVFAAAAQSQTIRLVSNTPLSWTATKSGSSSTEWLSIPVSSGTTGVANGTPNELQSLIVLTAAENTTNANRTATVQISIPPYAAFDIAITQQAAGNYLTVAPDSIALPAVPTSPFDIQVSSNTSWTVSSPDPWIKNVPTGTLTGDQTVSLTADPAPTTSPRLGSVVFTYGGTSRAVIVNQSGAQGPPNSCAPSVALDMTTLSVLSYATAYDVRVTSNTAWTATSDSNWMRPVNGAGGGSVQPGEIMRFAVDANASAADRTGRIAFYASCNPGAKVAELTVTQVKPSLSLQPARATIVPGATMYFTVYDNGVPVAYADLNWSISPPTTLGVVRDGAYESSSSARATDTAIITASLKANPSVSSSATITFQHVPLPVRVSINPTTGSGSHQLFVSTATPGGAGSIQQVQIVLGNSTTSGASSCAMAIYALGGSNNYAVLLDDAGYGFVQPVVLSTLTGPQLGANGYLENSQCHLNFSSSSHAITSGNAVTDSVDLSFHPVFAGSKGIFMYTQDTQGGQTAGLVNVGSYSVTASGTNRAPTPVSVNPASSGGTEQTFVASYADPDGVIDLESVFLLINSSGATQNGCLIRYDRRPNRLFLAFDNGTSWSTGVAPGQAASVGNSQCTLAASGATVAVDYVTNRLTVSVPLSFATGFGGQKNVYLYAKDYRSVSATAAVDSGDFIVEHGPTTSPVNSASVVSISAPAVVPAGANFTATVVMKNTGNTTWSTATEYRLGSQRPQDNTIWGTGRVALPSTTAPGQTAAFNISGIAPVTQGTSEFAWKMVRDGFEWFGQTAEATIQVVSATPAPPNAPSAAILSESGNTIRIRGSFSDPNGYSDLALGQMLIGNSLDYVGSCAWHFSGDHFYLINDAGNGWSPPIPFNTSASLENQFCAVQGVTRTTSGITVNVDVTITFKSSFAGTQGMWLHAMDSSGAGNGWVGAGTWTVPGNLAPSAVAVTPTSGKDWNHVVTARYTDPNGFENIRYVHTRTHTALTEVGSCMTLYSRLLNEYYLINENADGWLILGTSPSVSNSRCTLYRAGTTATGSGNDLTVVFNLRYATTFAGTKNVYAYVMDNGGVSNQWQQLATWVVGTPVAPAVTLDAPPSGAPVSGTVPITGSALDWPYETAISSVEVFIDGVKLGNATYGLARPDVCQASAAQPWCPNVGFNINWDTTAVNPGDHQIRVVARDSDAPTPNSTTVERAVSVIRSNQLAPDTPTATILSSSGNVLRIRGVFSDPNGAGDIYVPHMIINEDVRWDGGCSWHMTDSGLLLYKDGTGWLTPVAPNGAGTVENEYCRIESISRTHTGTAVIVEATFTLKPSLAGPKKVYVLSQDRTGTYNAAGWVEGASLTVSGNIPPTATGISPSSGRGWTHPLSVTFTDSNGFQNIRYVHTLTNSTLNGAGSCYTIYHRTVNELYLLNDAQTTWLPLGLNAGDAVSNSQCTIYRSGTSVSGSENTLTLTLNIQYAPAFAGTRYVYAYVRDNGAADNAWQQMGTWAVGAPFVNSPALSIDSPAANAVVSGTVAVSGWALDSANAVESAISQVEVYVDGTKIGNAGYGTNRQDVCNAYPGRVGCPNVGFSFNWNTAGYAPGAHTIRVVATDSDGPARTAYLDRTVTIPSPVQISVAPTSTTMNCLAARSFTATVTGGTTSAVNWAITNPSYAYMATLNSSTANPVTATGNTTYCAQQTRTMNVTATSAADPSRTASSAVTMWGSTSPTSATLYPGQQAIFYVPWAIGSANISPSIGYLNAPTGGATIYFTAPSSSSGGQKVTITVWNYGSTQALQAVVTLP